MILRKEIRLTLIGFCLPTGLGCLITLIAAKGSLEIESAVILTILGWLLTCLALWISGWFKPSLRTLLYFLTLIAALVISWFAWPNPLEETARFSFMLPYDTTQGHQPIPLDENPDDPLYDTYTDLAMLAGNGTVSRCVPDEEHTGQFKCDSESIPMAEAPDFLSRLLQFYLLQSIDNLERDTVIERLGYPAGSQAGINVPDRSEYPAEELAPQLTHNKFYWPYMKMPPPMQNWPRQLRNIVMPKESKVSLDHVKANDGSSRYVLRLKRTGYFDIRFAVEYSAGTGAGSLPKHFVTPYAATTMEWSFFITMSYVVQRRSYGGFQPETYAQWANDLFARLQRKFDPSK